MINLLAYKKIFVNTLNSFVQNIKSLLKAVLIPTILLLLINFALSFYIEEIKDLFSTFDIRKNIIPAFLISQLILIDILITITIFRIVILRDDAYNNYDLKKLLQINFKYLFLSGLVLFILGIVTYILTFIPNSFLATISILIIVPYLLSRLSFVFPACAIDEPISIKESWNLTSRYKRLTYFSVILFPFIVTAIISVPLNLSIGFLSTTISSKLHILYTFSNVLIVVLTVTSLSSVYKLLNPRKVIQPKIKLRRLKRKIEFLEKPYSYKVIIPKDLNYKFNSIKDELFDEYKKFNFKKVVYDRNHSWILKAKENDEAYVSLRYEKKSEDIVIHAYKTKKPKIKSITL